MQQHPWLRGMLVHLATQGAVRTPRRLRVDAMKAEHFGAHDQGLEATTPAGDVALSERRASLHRWGLALLAVAMVLVGAGRIISTYPVFSALPQEAWLVLFTARSADCGAA